LFSRRFLLLSGVDMKTFKIFEHPQRGREVVKVGFSWPALFFGILWMLFKGLWKFAGMWSAILLIMMFVENAVKTGVYDPQLKFILEYAVLAGYIAIMLIPAFKGNEWREKKMIDKGYLLKDTVKATSTGQAFKTIQAD
jgi:Flp pilus assembly pilin Flp